MSCTSILRVEPFKGLQRFNKPFMGLHLLLECMPGDSNGVVRLSLWFSHSDRDISFNPFDELAGVGNDAGRFGLLALHISTR